MENLCEISESVFVSECLRRGYNVLLPLLKALPYDFVVDSGNGMKKIQVKSTANVRHDDNGRTRYRVNIYRGGGVEYESKDVDLFAIYIFSINQWYIIPAKQLKGTTFTLPVNYIESKHEVYRNKFDLI